MILSPANEAFLDAVKKYSGWQVGPKAPTRSVAIVPKGGKFLVQLIDLTPDDPRYIKVLQEVVVNSLEEVPATLTPMELKEGEQTLVHGQHGEDSFRWTPFNDSLFTMRGVNTQDWGVYRPVV